MVFEVAKDLGSVKQRFFPPSVVISIDLSPAGNILATGSGDWQARICELSLRCGIVNICLCLDRELQCDLIDFKTAIWLIKRHSCP